MLYGENLCADEVVVKCTCGLAAIIEIFDQSKTSCGWFCRRCASKFQSTRLLRAIAKRKK